ncbi:hypothetical protein M0R04_04145 [Candidatus Dojkabacteria bacterium]|jgi:hypothetical protein|nr:hypothetical protein [Candidatus Dojkabacteria bacterium]
MENESKDFAGKDGFIWFTGIVEDRQDPIKLGRCKVRCVGWHSDNKMQLPTEMLPWAIPLFAVNNTSTYAPREGDMIFGFFLDGNAGQNPVMIGVFPSIPLKAVNSQSAFEDNRSEDLLKKSPRLPQSKEYKSDGTGVTIKESDRGIHYPHVLDEPTTSRLARNDAESIDKTYVKERKDNRITGIKTSNGSWDEPLSQYGTVYPYNNVRETESGHIMEFDDTPGKERVHIAHRTGTFTEFAPDGSRVDKIVRDNYQIVLKDNNVYIMGKCNITVQGDAEISVNQDAYLNIGGDVNFKVGGTVNGNVGGDVNITSPTFNLTGDVNVVGNITSTKQVTDHNRSMTDDRSIFNSHTHISPHGITSGPSPQE